MTDVALNPATDLNTQETHQEISSHHQEKPSDDQPDQQVPQENNQESSSKKTEPEQSVEQIILIEKKEIVVEFIPQTQPVLQETHNRAEYQSLRRSQDPKEVSSELYGLHAKVDKILGKYKTSNIPLYPIATTQSGHSSVENLLRNSTYLNNLNRAPSTETILKTSTYQNVQERVQERSKSRGHASPTKSPTKSVRFADDYFFSSKPSVYQSQISNNLSISPVRTRETREERPLKFSGYSSTVNTNVDVDHKPLYDQNKLDEIINRINGTPAPSGQNLRASKAFDVSPAINKSPLFDNYQSQMPQYVTVESRFEMEPLTSQGSLAAGAQNQQKMTSLVNSIDNLALKFGEQGKNEQQVEKTPEQLYAEHAQQFFENEENLRDFDFSKYKRI